MYIVCFSLEEVVNQKKKNKKQNMLSILKRPIVNILSVLKYSMSFLAGIQLKFVTSETTIKILLKIY